MTLRGFASIAVLASFLIGPCLPVCEGWSASTHEHMACCADKAKEDADTCCALGEGRANSEAVTGLVAFPPTLQPVSLVRIAIPLRVEHAELNRDARHPLTSTADRHALLSTFLI